MQKTHRLPAFVRRSEQKEIILSDKTDKTPDSKLPPSNFVFGVANLKPAISPKIINVTFPDGAKREFPQGTTGFDIAKGISPSLAKRTVAMALDGTVVDLNNGIEQDAKIEFINRDDPRAL